MYKDKKEYGDRSSENQARANAGAMQVSTSRTFSPEKQTLTTPIRGYGTPSAPTAESILPERNATQKDNAATTSAPPVRNSTRRMGPSPPQRVPRQVIPRFVSHPRKKAPSNVPLNRDFLWPPHTLSLTGMRHIVGCALRVRRHDLCNAPRNSVWSRGLSDETTVELRSTANTLPKNGSRDDRDEHHFEQHMLPCKLRSTLWLASPTIAPLEREHRRPEWTAPPSTTHPESESDPPPGQAAEKTAGESAQPKHTTAQTRSVGRQSRRRGMLLGLSDTSARGNFGGSNKRVTAASVTIINTNSNWRT